MAKKILALICALILAAACLASCKKSGNADVHVFYYTYSDPYISSVRSSLDMALGNAGLSYQDYDGNGNQTTQTEQIQTAITKGAKIILVNIVNTGSDDAASGIVALAKEKDRTVAIIKTTAKRVKIFLLMVFLLNIYTFQCFPSEQTQRLPVEPKPPAPRSVSSKESTSVN